MRARRVFAVIWRINAVLLLIVGLGAAVIISFTIVNLAGVFRHERAADPVAEAIIPAGSEQIARLGNFNEVKGSRMLRASLNTDDGKDYAKFSSGGSASITRNILFLDPDTGRAHWLMPGMDGIIVQGYSVWKAHAETSDEELEDAPKLDDAPRDAELLASAYLVINVDSNKDGRIDYGDVQKFALANPDGTRFQVVLDDVTELNRVALRPNGKIMVLYTADSKLRRAEFDPATFVAGEDKEITIVGNGER